MPRHAASREGGCGMDSELLLDGLGDSIERRASSPTAASTQAKSHCPVTLEELTANLHAARVLVSRERSASRHVTEWTHAQANLLTALEEYAAGLQSAGHPLPYRVRDELFMHRQLAGLGRVVPR
jgi:hypothetical protein